MSQSLSVPYPEKLKHIREKEFCQIGGKPILVWVIIYSIK